MLQVDRATHDVTWSDQQLAALHRRTLGVVVASQVLGGAGLAAGVTVGALLAQDMLGGDAVAGLPAALTTAGSAAAAYGVGRLAQRSGRRLSLAAGFAAGALGALGIVVAAVVVSPVLLFASLLVYGAGTATNLQARYAGTDLAPPDRRATAVSVALVSTTFGAVAGPLSVDSLGQLAASAGLPPLAGPFVLAGLAYGLAGAVLFAFLRPDPLLVAWAIAQAQAQAQATARPSVAVPGRTTESTSESTGAGTGGGGGLRRDGVLVGASVMVVTQVAMVAIMTMTPVHMRAHHDLGAIGVVIALHISAMFLPSLVTGRLVDRVGRLPMVAAAVVVLLAAGLVAALALAESMVMVAVALVLLGLGWNFGLISGTALVVDSTGVQERPRVQGSIDVLIAISGSAAGALSGVVVEHSSFAVLSLGGSVLALALLPLLARSRKELLPS